MKKQIIIAAKILGIMVILLGVIYPLLITGIGQLFFSGKANGSLITKDGIIIGSELIGQKMDKDIYFNSRPSVTDYNTLPSGASNLGLTSKKLHDLMLERKAVFCKKNNLPENAILPADMLFASASGLDPHISPEAAYLQINRIAKARNFSQERKKDISALVDKTIEQPQFGILGCARVNVFLLNLELDKLK